MIERYREQWLEQLPRYESLARNLREVLVNATREAGIPCSVEARAKDLTSFLKKCVRKNYSDPMSQMPDKAGVRLIVVFRDYVEPIKAIVQSKFNVIKCDPQGDDTDNLFGYSAVHFDAEIKSGDTEFAGLRFEVQLHVAGQSLWAQVSHKLAYKGPVTLPREVARRINRLSALLELFDQEVQSTRDTILAHPLHKPAQMLETLETHYYRFSGRPSDPDLSMKVLAAVGGVVDDDRAEPFAVGLTLFLELRGEKLLNLYHEYASDHRCSPFLFQAEALLIFWFLEKDPFKLEQAWNEVFPSEWLQELALIWGVSLQDRN
jgi:ppGpp synthetase/RelA/SpoT-type nucleotidyltranferase